MAFWLLKAEPEDYSWQQLVAEGETAWTGVRNHQAAGYLRAMQPGERAFFYRSGTTPAIVGVVTVAAPWSPDPDDPSGRFGHVRVRPLLPAAREVPLKAIKAEPRLAELALVRQPRLSVVPIDDAHWRLLCAMAGIAA